MKGEQERLAAFCGLIEPTIPRRKSRAAFREVAKFGEASVRRHLRGFLGSSSDHGPTSTKARHRPLSAVFLHQGKNAPTLRWSSTRWICCTVDDSTAFASFFRQRFHALACACANRAPMSRFRCAENTGELPAGVPPLSSTTENLLPEAVTSGADTPEIKIVAAAAAAIPILEKAIHKSESEDGWVMLGEVGGQISNLFSDFDVRSYGHRKLSDLVRKTGAFDVEKIAGDMRIRAKLADGAPKGRQGELSARRRRSARQLSRSRSFKRYARQLL